MIADCRAGKPEGWRFLARNFVPPIRWLLARYGKGEAELRAQLVELKNGGGMARFEPMVYRQFIAGMRPEPAVTGEAPFDLAALSEAMTDVPALERQNLWFETMGYDVAETARLLRQSVETATAARDRMLEQLRTKLDSWTRTMLRDHGPALGAAARADKPAEPVSFRLYLDVIDGRATWQNRADVERALLAHWYEIDQFCRVREADAAYTDTKPLTEEEAAPYLELLGVGPAKASFFRRLAGRGS